MRFVSLFRNLFRKRAVEQELNDELRSSLDILTQEKMRQGLSRSESRREALIELGGIEQVKEAVRVARAGRILEDFAKDVRFGFRTLAKSPGFTTVAVLTLALGIGANTAIFSLVDTVLLKMLPVREPEQLVRLMDVGQENRANDFFSYPTYKLLANNNRTLSGVIAFHSLGNVDLTVGGHAGLASGHGVSANYFTTLGVKALLGRTFEPGQDDVQGADPVAVISYGYWTRRFGASPSVVGKSVTLNGAPFTVIGVTVPEFFGLEPGEPVDISIPLAQVPSVKSGWSMTGSRYDIFRAPFRNWLRLMGRLRDGITMPVALANLQPVYAEAMRQAAEGLRGLPFDSPRSQKEISERKLRLESGSRGLTALRQQFSKPLLFLMAVVGVLLLIACTNVANLLLARASIREREIALRISLGAGRLRVVRQLLTESLLLGLVGGAFGAVLAYWGSSSLVVFMSHSQSPVELNVEPDLHVLVFTAMVSLVAVIGFGLAPAWRATKTELAQAVKVGGQGAGGKQRHAGLGEGLVVWQIALSLVLLVSAGLLVRTLEGLKDLNPGFDPENVLLLSVNPGMVGYSGPQVVGLYDRLSERIKAIPGVRNLSFSVFSPLGAGFTFTDASVEGYTSRSGENTAVSVNFVSPGYFKTLRTSVVLGREFTDADKTGAPKVAVINEAMAHYFFGSNNALGRRFSIPGWKGDPSPIEIVGVVENAKLHDLRSQPPPAAYLPFLQDPDSVLATTFEIRTAANPGLVAGSVRHVIEQIDGRVPVFGVKTLHEQVNESLIQERLVASLSSLFGFLALFLTSVGLYGLMSYSVTRRIREIGIRMALGARKPQVLRMVLRRGISLSILGVALGTMGALGLTRVMKTLLYGVKPTDLITFLAASLILISVSILAGFLPARRATKVDPMVALRYE